jgi:exodeoxyribonuclease V beta subunit
LRTKYCALLVDEFQDTDPLQWNIFLKIFLDSCHEQKQWHGFLYLVGDPKQAIYAFRQADVYSYINAKNFFSKDAHLKLTTNFRANESLTAALNRLFVGPQSVLAFYLPKLR